MAEEFGGMKTITVRPGTSGRMVRHRFPTCSAEDEDDGWTPYGDTIASVVAQVYDPSGTDVSSDMVTLEPSVDGEIVIYELSWFDGAVRGWYQVVLTVTFASGKTDVAKFNKRVFMDV